MNALEAVARLIRWATSGAVYDGLYPATVQGVNGANSIEVLPDEPIAGNGQALIVGDSDPPNTELVPALGARCLIGFRGSDPRRPYIAEWESGGLTRIGFDHGTREVARLSDPIELAMPPTVTVTGVVQGVQTLPGPPPVPVVIPATPLVGGVAVVAPAPTAIVQSGHPKLLA